MNFEQAIRAHAAWRSKLSLYATRPDHSLTPEDAGGDEHCPLGRWLHTDAPATDNPLISRVDDAHRRFHECAGELVRRADRGEKIASQIAIGDRSSFNAAAGELVQLLVELRAAA